MKELSTLHETYIQMKANCMENDKDLPVRALHEINEDFNELMLLKWVFKFGTNLINRNSEWF